MRGRRLYSGLGLSGILMLTPRDERGADAWLREMGACRGLFVSYVFG